MDTLKLFLQATEYIDFLDISIQQKAKELFVGCRSDVEKAEKAYYFVRDDIPHAFDIQATVITAKASDVLKYKTGICHAKSNLLAALLRSQNIPCGMCFEHLTLADDDSLGYCVHCYNAIFLNEKWVKIDARGNKEGVNAQFSLDEPVLAYPPREQYDEYFYNGIYALPNKATMQMLENAKTLQDALDYIPCNILEKPDIMD